MKRAALYLRVSTIDQTTANQERELRQVAERAGWEVDKVYKDHGISGSKGRDKRGPLSTRCIGPLRAGKSISSWPGRSIGSAAHCKILLPYCPRFMPPVSISSCINRAWTRPHRQAKRYFK